MPSFIVEDGSIVAGATAYGTIAEAIDEAAFHVEAAQFLGSALAEQQLALMLGARGVDKYLGRKYRGYLVDAGQSLLWPRYSVCDDQGRLRPSDVVPQEIKVASFILAFKSRKYPTADLAATALDAATGSSGGQVVELEQQLGPMKERTKYAEGATVVTDPTKVGLWALAKTEIRDCLRGLLDNGNYLYRG